MRLLFVVLGVGMVALAGCSAPLNKEAQRATLEVGKSNIVEFKRRAPDLNFVADVTIDKDNPNIALLNLKSSWDTLLSKEQALAMQVWFGIWKNITLKKPAPGAMQEIKFYPEMRFYRADRSLIDVYADAR